MKPLRVGVTVGTRPHCGVADYARRLAAGLPDDCDVRWIVLPEGGDARAFRTAARDARGLDVVHVHFEYGLFAPVKPWRNRLASFLDALEAPAVVTLHGDLPTLQPRATRPFDVRDAVRDAAYRPFFGTWEREVHAKAAHWIAHVEAQRTRAVEAAGAARVSLERHPVPRASGRRCVDPRSEVRLVVPGFTKAHKGYDRLLPLLASRADVRLILAGGPQDARDAADLRAFLDAARARGVERRIEVTGYLEPDALEVELCRARLVVLPYVRGGASGALSWAIAVGAPVAATDLPAFRELRDEGAGLALLPAADADPGPALAALCDDPAALDALSDRNRVWAERHSYEASAHRLAELLSRVARAS